MAVDHEEESTLSPISAFTDDQCILAYEEMVIRVMSSWSVQAILDYGERQLKNLLLLYTVNGSHLYHSNRYASDLVSNVLLSSLRDPDVFFEKLKCTQDSAETEVDRVYEDKYSHSGTTALRMNLIGKNSIEAVLVLLPIECEYTRKDAELLRVIGLVLEECLIGGRSSTSFSKSSFPLNGSDINKGTAWLRSIAGHRFQNFYIAVAEAPGDDARARIKAILSEELRFFHTENNDGQMIMLINCEEGFNCEDLKKSLFRIGSELGISVGLSDNFFSTAKIRVQYSNAMSALKHGSMTDTDPGLHDFSELRTSIMIQNALEHIHAEYYNVDGLEELRRIDAETNGELYNTLHVYLNCGCVKQTTSQKLNIHRNTLAYRLNRIASITHFDVNNKNEMFNLWFATKIKESAGN